MTIGMESREAMVARPWTLLAEADQGLLQGGQGFVLAPCMPSAPSPRS